MGTPIDLAQMTRVTKDFALEDGSVLHVRKPSQRIMHEILVFEASFKADPENVSDTIGEFIDLTFSYNTDGVVIDEEWRERNSVDPTVCLALYSIYAEFVQELVNVPNSESPQSPTKATRGKQKTSS